MSIKFQGRANDVANKLLDVFKSGNIAQPLATVFMNHGSSIPMYGWSYNNALACILFGCSDARGFRQWKKVGRTVKKGEKAKAAILVPLTMKRENTEGEEMFITYGFRGVPVFDVEQTEGDEVPEEEVHRFLESLPLRSVADKWELSLSAYKGHEEDAYGRFWRARSINGERMGISLGVENVSVWLHELVHAADYRTGALKKDHENDVPKWQREIVAELGSCVLAHMIGFGVEADDGGCWEYVQSWAATADIEPVTACFRMLDRTTAAVELIVREAQSGESIGVIAD